MTTVNKSYNDGVCTICREINDRSSFSARISPTTIDDLEVICKMAFADNSIRLEDADYANKISIRLDRKISVRRPGGIKIDTECSVLIGRMLYHIGYIDPTSTELYLSLTEAGELEVEDA